MITSRFPLGDVSFSAEYFSTLVGEATKQCYGVSFTRCEMERAAWTIRPRASVSHRKRAVS